MAWFPKPVANWLRDRNCGADIRTEGDWIRFGATTAELGAGESF
jgi:hypothetical protein